MMSVMQMKFGNGPKVPYSLDITILRFETVGVSQVLKFEPVACNLCLVTPWVLETPYDCFHPTHVQTSLIHHLKRWRRTVTTASINHINTIIISVFSYDPFGLPLPYGMFEWTTVMVRCYIRCTIYSYILLFRWLYSISTSR